MPLSLAGMRYLYQRLLATSPAEERWGKSALWVLPQWHALLPCSLIRNYYSDLWQCLLGLWSWVKALKKPLCWVLNFLCKALSLSWRVSNLIFERKQKGDAGKASTLLPLGCTHFNSCHLKMKIYGFKAKANVLFPLPFIKFLGISLFTRLNSSAALGCGSAPVCFLAVDFSSLEGDLSAEQGFDVWMERRIRIWSKVSSEVKRTCLLEVSLGFSRQMYHCLVKTYTGVGGMQWLSNCLKTNPKGEKLNCLCIACLQRV